MMKFILLVFISSSAFALSPVRHPKDVSDFMKRRDSCDHFRGEEPYDGRRAAEIAKNIDKYCKGTDKQLSALRKKYSNNPEILKALSSFEEKIE